jgi:hypothetical protein
VRLAGSNDIYAPLCDADYLLGIWTWTGKEADRG